MKGERGSVTVEAALVIGAIVTALLLAITAVAAAADHVRCLDAAAQAARLATRGDFAQARAAAVRSAPNDATITIHTSGDTVAVTVNTNHPLFPTHVTAYAVLEPGVPP
ncbi:TadE family type IV pilus minor pilin [Actinokineospora globicatena]|uniref:TadE family type IV pilus minor pilin n=1 Tax=Actinokineospora globicatena TaxID=103729 RepID=UPI0020A4BFB2|nr:TadE family type IV pilus minor pilin [Actinokineospora globicatena]MCP2300959.1 hypothetical protein [Actinokineospora globicatena]GLW77410.1 hypothetical protein Aglo01_18920 [Actinokineospora globicatena]GLW84244.1 hypothetical protein Aglo02_18840 [Actinokineospora globicatena]